MPASKEQCTVIVGQHEANVVLKDNDLHVKISLAPFEAYRVLDILKKDSDLLGELGVLDYSLLVGVKKKRFAVEVPDEEVRSNSLMHIILLILPSSGPRVPIANITISPLQLGIKSSDASAETAATKTAGKSKSVGMGDLSTFRAVSVTGPAIYYLGIVDFLQDWTTKKKIERAFKIYATRKDPDGLSVMDPERYKRRFQTKMEQIFDTEGPPATLGRSWSKAHSLHAATATAPGPMVLAAAFADDSSNGNEKDWQADVTEDMVMVNLESQKEVPASISRAQALPSTAVVASATVMNPMIQQQMQQK